MNSRNQIKWQAVLILFYFFWMSGPVSAQNEYKLGPGDALEVFVWNDEQLSRQVVVPPDCIVSYPLVGDFDVKGKTVPELESEMQARFEKYLPDSPVSVSLLSANDLRIYITGKVNKPGVFPINLGTNVMQAISMAGGLSTFADGKKIIILRNEDNKIIKLEFNYSEVEKGKNLEQNIILKRGDVIVIP